MVIALFSLNIILFLSTSLAIIMFYNHLCTIDQSIQIYSDPKAYKPAHKVQFLVSLFQKYKIYQQSNDMDIESLITNCFYEQRIGIFSTIGVEIMVHSGKELLWFSTITMVLFKVLNQDHAQSNIHFTLIIISAVMGILLIFFQICTGLGIRKEKLIIKVQDYLKNKYPYDQIKSKQKEEVYKLLERIGELETQVEQLEKLSGDIFDKQQKIREPIVQSGTELKEKDIADLLESFTF